MEVILVQDVPHLGLLGDQVLVKDGFARNYLLPRGMAIVATSKRSGQIEHQRKRLELLRQDAIVKAQSESDTVAALELRVQAKAGVNGKLFGSVTNRDIQAALAEQGYELDRRAIQLHTLIKSIGNFTATVKLHTDVKVDVSIKVEAIADPGAGAVTEGEEGEAATQDEAVSESKEEAAGDSVDDPQADQAQSEAGEASPDDTPAAGSPDDAPAAGSGADDAGVPAAGADVPTAGDEAAAAPSSDGDAPDASSDSGLSENDGPETPSDGKDASGGQN